MTAQRTITATTSAEFVNLNNTTIDVTGNNLRMTFFGGHNDNINVMHTSGTTVVAENTTGLGIAASQTTNLGLFLSGSVMNMNIVGWGGFSTGETIQLYNQPGYSLKTGTDAPAINGLQGGFRNDSGHVGFVDSYLQASQVFSV